MGVLERSSRRAFTCRYRTENGPARVLSVIIERFLKQFFRLFLKDLAFKWMNHMVKRVVAQLSHLVFRTERREKILLLHRQIDQVAADWPR